MAIWFPIYLVHEVASCILGRDDESWHPGGGDGGGKGFGDVRRMRPGDGS